MVGTADVGYQTQDEPRYKEVLRPIGAYLDRLQAQYVTLCETEEGFVWHCFPHGDLTKPASGMISHNDVPHLLEQLKGSRRVKRGLFGRRTASQYSRRRPARENTVCPAGYQETFRSLGHQLDREKAIAVLIVETDKKLTLNYHYPMPGFLRRDTQRREYSSTLHEDEYDRDQVAQCIAESRRRRNNPFFY